jgi:hypothetical protein
MNTFCGCDDEILYDYSETIDEWVERIIELFEELLTATRTVPWIGPDAEAHRAQMAAASSSATEVCSALRERAALLRSEADAQTAASSPDGGLAPALPLQANLFEKVAEIVGGPGIAAGRRVGEAVGGAGWGQGGGHPYFGPMGHHDPAGLARGVTERAARIIEEIRGLPLPVGGPIIAPGVPRPPRDLPTGEEWAISEENLQRGTDLREEIVSWVPVAGTVQKLLGVHDEIGTLLSDAESTLSHVVGEDLARAFVAPAEISHATTGLIAGPDSAVHRTLGLVDRNIANFYQTGDEAIAALGDGDLGAAARAVERGTYRHWENSASLVTGGTMPDVLGTGADISGIVGEAVAPFDPGAAERIGGVEDALREAQTTSDTSFTAEDVYDARRRVAPLPWDPAPAV